MDLGVAQVRVLASGDVANGEARSLLSSRNSGRLDCATCTAEWRNRSVLDGHFTFTVGGQRIPALPETYVLVPRGTAHTFEAGPGGGKFLLLMVPGGLERMFFELADLPPNSITDAAVRAAIAARYDSIPVNA